MHIFGKKHAFQISTYQDILFIVAFMKFLYCLNSGIFRFWCVCVCVQLLWFLNGRIESAFVNLIWYFGHRYIMLGKSLTFSMVKEVQPFEFG